MFYRALEWDHNNQIPTKISEKIEATILWFEWSREAKKKTNWNVL